MSTELSAAHRQSSRHRSEVERSPDCGCFFCRSVFPPALIECRVDEAAQPNARPGQTAVCPHCGVDAVIGSAGGFTIIDADFPSRMLERWFR